MEQARFEVDINVKNWSCKSLMGVREGERLRSNGAQGFFYDLQVIIDRSALELYREVNRYFSHSEIPFFFEIYNTKNELGVFFSDGEGFLFDVEVARGVSYPYLEEKMRNFSIDFIIKELKDANFFIGERLDNWSEKDGDENERATYHNLVLRIEQYLKSLEQK